MSQLLSEVQICNMALGWIGAGRITSFSGESEEANLCNLNYATSRDIVLESRDWTFATRRYTLNPTGETPEPPWSQEFTVPTEILRVLTVNRGNVSSSSSFAANLIDPQQANWLLEENKILTDLDIIYVKAIIRITNTTKFSTSFVHALAARIAADLAIPISRSKTLQQQMFALYQAKLADAAATDGMQGRSQRIRSRFLIQRR